MSVIPRNAHWGFAVCPGCKRLMLGWRGYVQPHKCPGVKR